MARLKPFFKVIRRSAQVAQRMVLLARTLPHGASGVKPSECLSLFFAKIREDDGKTLKKGIEMRKIRKMGGRGVDSNEVPALFYIYYPHPSMISQTDILR